MCEYFIEYPNHNFFLCYDGLCTYINSLHSQHGNNYLFIQFIYRRTKMYNAIKKVIKLKNKNSMLYVIIDLIIDKYLTDLDKNNSFQYILLPKILKDKDSPTIYICCSDNFYDTFVGNITAGRSRKKIPLVYHHFR